jgi:tyrosinase
VLFPLWHRAYLLRLENALRSIPGCQDVTLPFWDECFASTSGGGNPIPTILTTPTFDLDGRKDNPLYSYKLQCKLEDARAGRNGRYTNMRGTRPYDTRLPVWLALSRIEKTQRRITKPTLTLKRMPLF